MTVVAALIAGALMFSAPVTVATGCHLKIGVAVACQGGIAVAPGNAVALYQTYGFNAARIRSDAAQAYLNSYGCVRVDERAGSLDIRHIGSLSVPLLDGSITVGYYYINRRNLYIANSYLTGMCLRPKLD